MIEITVSQTARRTPCQIESTLKPSSFMSQAVSQTKRPFRKRAPKPSVHAVIGSAKRMSAGQMSALRTPRIAVASNAHQKLPTSTPGTIAAPIISPTAFSTQVTRMRVTKCARPWAWVRRWIGFAFPLTRVVSRIARARTMPTDVDHPGDSR